MTTGGLYDRGGAFRLNVWASNISETVQFAGGWIFDQVRMGWTVSVVIPHDCDDRPLRILGATLRDADSAFGIAHHGADASTLAVAATLYEQDGKVRDLVRAALARGNSRVVVWGQPCQTELGLRLEPTEHHLSSAARIFKTHALGALSLPQTTTGTERFYSRTSSSTARRGCD